MKTVSVIVPVYHVENYLKQCVDSILNQTYTELEVILIDDGGDDRCPEICNQYCLQDKRVKCIHKQNEGQSMARKTGLSIATGKYIMYVDADDWIEKETIEKSVEIAEQKSADIVCFGYKRVYNNRVFETPIFEEDKEFQGDEIKLLHRKIVGAVGEELRYVESAERLVTMWGKLYLREVALNGIWVSERITGSSEDAVYNLGAFKKCKKCVYVHSFFYNYRKTDENTTTTKYRENLAKQWENLYVIFENYITDNNLGKEFDVALNNRIALGMLGLGLNELNSAQSLFGKAKKLRNILSENRWNRAFEQLEFRYFPPKWKIFYGLCKTQKTEILLFMLWIIKKLKAVLSS